MIFFLLNNNDSSASFWFSGVVLEFYWDMRLQTTAFQSISRQDVSQLQWKFRGKKINIHYLLH